MSTFDRCRADSPKDRLVLFEIRYKSWPRNNLFISVLIEIYKKQLDIDCNVTKHRREEDEKTQTAFDRIEEGYVKGICFLFLFAFSLVPGNLLFKKKKNRFGRGLQPNLRNVHSRNALIGINY